MERQRRGAVMPEREGVDGVVLAAAELRKAPGVERHGLLTGDRAGVSGRAGRTQQRTSRGERRQQQDDDGGDLHGRATPK
jgi:hypothetical protein